MQKYKNHIQYLNYILIGQKTTRILFLALIVGFFFFFFFFFFLNWVGLSCLAVSLILWHGNLS